MPGQAPDIAQPRPGIVFSAEPRDTAKSEEDAIGAPPTRPNPFPPTPGGPPLRPSAAKGAPGIVFSSRPPVAAEDKR